MKIEIQVTPEMRQEAKGRLIQQSIQAASYYEGMSDSELLDRFGYQTWNHHFGVCIGRTDDVELYTVTAILSARGLNNRMKEVRKTSTDESRNPYPKRDF